jgi:hypothetical protein
LSLTIRFGILCRDCGVRADPEAVRRAATRDDGTTPGVQVQLAHGRLVVEVEDPGEASSQRALADLVPVADRPRALEGRLTVELRAGGVVIRAELPCA